MEAERTGTARSISARDVSPEQCTNLRIWRRFFSEDVKKNHLETLEMLF